MKYLKNSFLEFTKLSHSLANRPLDLLQYFLLIEHWAWISYNPSLFSWFFTIVLPSPVIINITATFIFHGFLSSLP